MVAGLSFSPCSGAVCSGLGTAWVPLLEAWGIAVYVLPHSAPEEAVDQAEQGHLPQGWYKNTAPLWSSSYAPPPIKSYC